MKTYDDSTCCFTFCKYCFYFFTTMSTVCNFLVHTLMVILMKLNSFRNLYIRIIGKWVHRSKWLHVLLDLTF
ncbi:hypothetical protein BDZ91DRAFT_718167 [Kalaharituber pfeilii]|nr:hypothetical protein BDZ91DRAFT_718167 [Kalaharituber pfeilii]